MPDEKNMNNSRENGGSFFNRKTTRRGFLAGGLSISTLIAARKINSYFPRNTQIHNAAPLAEEATEYIFPGLKIANDARNEALAKGENRIPVPQEVLDAKGDVRESTDGSLSIVLPDSSGITFPSFTKGRITSVKTLDNTTTSINIADKEGMIWTILIPATTPVYKNTGEVDFGTPLFGSRYRQEDGNQRTFELSGNYPRGTVASIYQYDPATRTSRALSVERNILKKSDGSDLTIPSIPYNPKPNLGQIA